MSYSSTDHTIVLYGTLAVFNLINLVLVNRILKQDLSGLLIEKGPLVATLDDGKTPAPQQSSYSRVAGMIGATVLAVFLWAFGNIVLYLSMTNPAGVTEVLSGVGSYFLAGSALFAPYAVNQLRTTFNPTSLRRSAEKHSGA